MLDTCWTHAGHMLDSMLDSTRFMLAMKNQSRFSVSQWRMVTKTDAAISGSARVKAMNSTIVTLLIRNTG